MVLATRYLESEARLGSLAQRCLRVLAAQPGHKLALEILETLLGDHLENRPKGPLSPVWLEASRALRARQPKTLPRASRNLLDITSILEKRLQTEKNCELRTRLFWQLIRMYEKNLGWTRTAFLTAARAFGENSRDDDLRQKLEWLACKTGRLDQLAQIFRQALVQAQSPTSGLVIRRRLAELFRTQGKSAELSEVIMQLAMIERSPGRRKSLLRELTSLWASIPKEQDLTLAFLACCRLYREDPSREEVQPTLEWLAKETGSLEELSMLLDEDRQQ